MTIREKFKHYFSERRNRQLLFNVIGNYLVKGGSLFTALLIIPAYMRYFESKAILGMWFTLTQLLNWIMLLDFGIGGGLRNKIIKPLKENNTKVVIELVSAAYFSVAAIVAILILFACYFVPHVNWYTVLGISSTEIDSGVLQQVVLILIMGVLFRFFTTLISHIFYALQKAVLPGLMILFANIIILLYLMFSEPKGMEKDIVTLAYVTAIANNLPAVIATIWVFLTSLKGMWPRLSAINYQAVKEVLGTGGSLFYLQVLIMLLFNVKEIYISWFFGPESVVDYQIYYKLIGIVGGLYSLALTPVWSAVTDAMVEKQYHWVRGLYKKGITLLLVFGIAQFFIVPIMPFIVRVWLKKNAIQISMVYGLLFCCYNIVYMWMMLIYYFACGMGRTKKIAFWLTLAGIFNYLFTAWGSRLTDRWIVVIVATTLAVIPSAIVVQRDIQKVMNVDKQAV